MKYKNIILHNVNHLEKGIISRLPKTVIETLGYNESIKGREKAYIPAHCELRFVTKSDTVEIILKAVDANSFITCYYGDFEIGRFLLHKNKKQTITLQKHERFLSLNPTKENSLKRFSPEVVRVVFENGSKIKFYDINTFDEDYRAPLSTEVPKTKVLVYGSSISQGVGSFSITNSYIQTFAIFSGVDIINKALSGSCLCEDSMIEYLSLYECDYYLFELGCNMRGCMTIDEFKRRILKLIKTVRNKNAEKPIFINNILSFFVDKYSVFDNVPYHDFNIEAVEFIRSLPDSFSNIYVIDAAELMPDITCISYDMLHPSEWGHHNMGIRLAEKISKILNK